jgi:hypothetical protein
MFSEVLEVREIEHSGYLQNRGRSGHKTKEQHILLVYRVHFVADEYDNEYDKELKKIAKPLPDFRQRFYEMF